MTKIKSEGKCLFCEKTASKSTITRHLNSHLEKMETVPNQKSYHIKVELDPRYGKSGHFLHLWISDKAKMEDIDDFLRGIWLECCGHMSSFTDIATLKSNKSIMDLFDFSQSQNSEIDMSKKVSKIFYENQKLRYEYDFGTTTSLLLTVVAIFDIKSNEKITLLSRNEPLEYLCETCKVAPATTLCTVHDWEEESMFCSKCAKKHAKTCEDFDDYAAMPVVNSPRMGQCAYEGGSIDNQRDGIFIKK